MVLVRLPLIYSFLFSEAIAKVHSADENCFSIENKNC